MTSTQSETVQLWDLGLPAKAGSLLYLAAVAEAVAGSEVSAEGAVVPTRHTLEEVLGEHPEVVDLFGFQFATWRAERPSRRP